MVRVELIEQEHRRQHLPSCLVTRVGDVSIKASQTSIVTVIAEVLHARSAETDACAPTPGLADSAQARTKALWTALPRDASDRVFGKLYAEWLVGEGVVVGRALAVHARKGCVTLPSRQ